MIKLDNPIGYCGINCINQCTIIHAPHNEKIANDLDYFRGRVNVVLRCKANYHVHGAGGMYSPNEKYIVITVINKGKRPVTIQNVGYITKRKKHSDGILIDSLLAEPRELTEGKSADYLVRQSAVDLVKIKYFVAYDSVGRKYKGKLKIK